ncbi:hypothetical protein A6E05_10130 [Aliivibrio sp. 1S165]|nr:hypothetical protein A6E05_10130 [Aliivibrio sp. 1S165]OCH35848.1 hypothetical protein A6E06_10860 [Aliivibrio sp. 1S175]
MQLEVKFMEDRNSFTFALLSYNHSKYIIEHLESIKFLVDKYASNIDVDLIINDDFSKDNTRDKIDLWLCHNENIFKRVLKIYNDVNLGTCKSTLNIINNCNTDYIKITAGDDVFSYENIFSFAVKYNKGDIISGLPIGLINHKLDFNHADVFNIVASDVIYSKVGHDKRFKSLSFNNAPNIIYNLTKLKSDSLKRFLGNYDVVEDLPIQINLAESNDFKFIQDYKTYVYYRRTEGSTYIIANDRFKNDQVKIFDYLIDKENNIFDKLILKSRKYSFLKKNRVLKKIFNLGIYLYLLRLILNVKTIFVKYRSVMSDSDIDNHKLHFDLINKRSQKYNVN